MLLRKFKTNLTQALTWKFFRALVHEFHEQINLDVLGPSTRPNSDMVPIPVDPEKEILDIIAQEDFETQF